MESMKKIIYLMLMTAVMAVACQGEVDPFEGVVRETSLKVEHEMDIFPVEGGEIMLTVNLKSELRSPWTAVVSPGGEWCVLSESEGKTSSTVTLTVDANVDEQNKPMIPRQALVTFSSEGCKDVELVVNQEGWLEGAMPEGVTKLGANYNVPNQGDVTLVVYEENEKKVHYDFCYVIGDFSAWEPAAEYAMTRDVEKRCWWITFNDVEPAQEYRYQYYMGNVGKEAARVADLFSEVAYTENDSSVPADTYPDLPVFPEETNGMVSAFQMQKEEYEWTMKNFIIKDPHDLVIYELLVRDFCEEKNLQGVLDRLEYLENLGINAIELMPVQEFDNHDSWGYDPVAYFAMEKDYGTRNMYKKFVDECHQRGIAVIVDVVYNQVTGLSPLVKMYYEHCRVSLDNPWVNLTAPHGFSVFEDLKHTSPFIKYLVKESLRFLIEEYGVDGFRFDLTKGFTQNSGTEGSWDPQRIDNLKEYRSFIKGVDENAVMICEHLVGGEEEVELSKHDIKLWRNMNHSYCNAASGSSDCGLSGVYATDGLEFGSLVSYMESHDEERMGFKQLAWFGAGSQEAMKRLELNAAFFLLVPGPKMIWQFGELGYDFSINADKEGVYVPGEDHRTENKPIRWDYLENEARRALYDGYARLIEFRKQHATFFDLGAWVKYEYLNDFPGKCLYVKDKDTNNWFAVVGNFGLKTENITVKSVQDGPSGPWWDYYDNTQTYSGMDFSITLNPGEYKILTTKMTQSAE